MSQKLVARRLWIALICALAGAGIVFALTRSLDAVAASLVASGLATALAYDAAHRSGLSTGGKAEPASRRAEHHAATRESALIAGIPIPVLIVERSRVAQANPPAIDLLGAHIAGQDVRLAIRNPAALDAMAQLAPDGGPAMVEMVGLGGADQRWSLRIVPLLDGPVADRRQLLALIDQSGRYAAERMRVDFVANASHELRTPLAGILGFVETLRDPVAGADATTRDRFLGIIDGEARRMQRLVEDLISLSRIEADKYRAPESPVALGSLAEEVGAIFRLRTDLDKRTITIHAADDLPPVRGDHTQLSQLLHNLVSNAIKYGAPGTGVTVDIAPGEGGMVRLSVADQGEGIPAEHLPRLTERFYRVDSSRSRAMGGTGLGLAIVKHIVERHRGRLAIASEIGAGTRVTIELPRMPEPEAA